MYYYGCCPNCNQSNGIGWLWILIIIFIIFFLFWGTNGRGNQNYHPCC